MKSADWSGDWLDMVVVVAMKERKKMWILDRDENLTPEIRKSLLAVVAR